MRTIRSIHDLGSVSHIEDIVVRKDQQGKKLGLRIIEALDHVSKEVGCYKVSNDPYNPVLYLTSPRLLSLCLLVCMRAALAAGVPVCMHDGEG